MPYTRAELLVSVRHDHPEFAQVPDNDLFRAIATDHPHLALGTDELSHPSTPDDRTWQQVAIDQMGHAAVGVGKGLVSPITGAYALGKSIINNPHVPGMEDLKNLGMGISDTAAGMVKPFIEGSDPGSPDWAGAAEGAGQLLGSSVIPAGIESAKGVYGAIKANKVPSVPLFTKHFSSGAGPEFQKYAPQILEEIKAAAPQGGIKSVQDGLDALETRRAVYDEGIKHYLEPNKGIDIQNRVQAIQERALNAIPETATEGEVRLAQAKIIQRTRNTKTIGDVDTLRKESNARYTTAKRNVATGGAKADITTQAVDKALADAARDTVEHAMDTEGLGGGQAVRLMHGKIGAIMHGHDALSNQLNAAIGEQAVTPWQAGIAKASRSTSKMPIVKPLAQLGGAAGLPIGGLATEAPMTLDEALSTAVKNHGSLPTEITSQLRADAGPKYQPLSDAPDKGTLAGEQQELAPSENGGLLGTNEYTPTEGDNFGMLQDIRQRQLWDQTKPLDLSNPQGDLQTGMAPTVMGIDQTPGPASGQPQMGSVADTPLAPEAMHPEGPVNDEPINREEFMKKFFENHPWEGKVTDPSRLEALKKIRGGG